LLYTPAKTYQTYFELTSETVAKLARTPILELIKTSELGINGLMANGPEAALKSLAADGLQLVDGLMNPLSEQVTGLSRQVGDLVDNLLPPVSGSPIGGRVASPADSPLAPAAPTPIAPLFPLSASNSLSGVGSFDGTFLLLLGVVATFSIFLLEGRFSWPSGVLHKPNSAFCLALERPG
jgi:hypothetical protein